MNSSGPISIVILTLNEAANLPACLASLQGLNARVFVVDSGSTDSTVGLARSFGANVLQHPWIDYATQFNWAVANIPGATGWILRLDADERLTPELRAFISDRLPLLSSDITGVLVRLRIRFLGRWIRHGGMYPIWLLRL